MPAPRNTDQWLPRTLVVDNYDSYTYNLVQLLTKVLLQHKDPSTPEQSDLLVHSHIVVIRNDQYKWTTVRDRILPEIDNVVISPGPGSPDIPEDFGICRELLAYAKEKQQWPVLGVCLGHQGIGAMFGARIQRGLVPVHGQISRIEIAEDELFAGIPSGFRAVRYHSLVLEDVPPQLKIIARAQGSVVCNSNGDEIPSREIMAIRSSDGPLWGVQFHPESVCSEYGLQIIENFIDITSKRRSYIACNKNKRAELSREVASMSVLAQDRLMWTQRSQTNSQQRFELLSHKVSFGDNVDSAKLGEQLFTLIHKKDAMPVWLDSSDGPGMSVLASALDTATIRYDRSQRRIAVQKYAQNGQVESTCVHSTVLPSYDENGIAVSFWTWMQQVVDQTRAVDSTRLRQLPAFQCGWIGYFGYELKSECLAGYHQSSARFDNASLPDAQMTFIDRCIVLQTGDEGAHAYVMALVKRSDIDSNGSCCCWLDSLGFDSHMEAHKWIADKKRAIEQADFTNSSAVSQQSHISSPTIEALQPTVQRSAYLHAIGQAQKLIAAGESYEICLTNEFQARVDPLSVGQAQAMYKRMRQHSPAPYGAFIWMGDQQSGILSCSPERFLRIQRGADGHAVAEMKPIKGTCRRQPPPCEKDAFAAWKADDDHRQQVLRDSVKERAENLMIVDLVRHDLNAIAWGGQVEVPRLIAIESFRRVHQLVSTVRARVREHVGAVAAVAHCFPPGSMTGAPKPRSVQLIELLEGRERGVYSGVLGYVSAAGGCSDWSVVIRTAVVDNERVRVGAGGALTFLSQPAAEWDEIETKVHSISPALQ
ncbi:para-aminobenzoate synthase, (PABA) [Coemansia sp. RSA 2336]|nr:para-aminobenzoate synthase, (PABA) [Coemansia sp. RSA 2336]